MIELALYLYIVLLVLVFAGVPIVFALAVSAFLGFLLIDVPPIVLAQATFVSLHSFPLLAIPLFVLAGVLMELGKMAERIVDVARAIVGTFPGSMGVVSLSSCAFFAALSGSAPATTAAVGAMTVPAMLRDNYTRSFAGAIVASGGTLGVLIPPSNILIWYGILSDTSIPQLFLAGLLPGVIAAGALMGCLIAIAWWRDMVPEHRAETRKSIPATIWRGSLSLLAPVIILGGIYSGVFTPTEAAAVAVLYALIVCVFIYRTLSIREIAGALKTTALICGTVVIIVAPAKAFAEVMTYMGIPGLVSEVLAGHLDGPVVTMLLLTIILVIGGMFLDPLALLVIFVPIMLPIAVSVGVDPIMFGIFFVLCGQIGFITPPVGVNLFVASTISKADVASLSVAVLPFVLSLMLVIILIVLFPGLATLLPYLVYG